MKQVTEEQIKTTQKARYLREISKNDDEWADLMGRTKVTLYSRLKNHNWKEQEIPFIDNLYDFHKSNQNSENLPKPQSQVQEVLYELINREKIDRPYMMNHCHVYNLTARISNLRDKGIIIETVKNIGQNKFGREVEYCHYILKDKENSIKFYNELVSQIK